MGAWGSGIFENDTALDWADDFARSGAPAVEDAVMNALGGGYLDADVASKGLAACAVVAAANGAELSRDAPDSMAGPVSTHSAAIRSADLAGRCQRIMLRVLDDDSELRALWEDAAQEDFKSFASAVAALKAKLPDVAPADLSKGLQGEGLEYGLPLPVTPVALVTWLTLSFERLEVRAGLGDGLSFGDDSLGIDRLPAYLAQCCARLARLEAHVGAQVMSDTPVPLDDASPGGLRAVEVMMAGRFMAIEAQLNGEAP